MRRGKKKKEENEYILMKEAVIGDRGDTESWTMLMCRDIQCTV